MSDLYWITVLGNIRTLSLAFLLIGSFASVGLSVKYLIESNDADYGLKRNTTISIIRRYRNVAYAITSVSILFTLFVPNKKELYMIYGVGGTIDYLKENPTAKKLPDKCIEIIDKWVDEMLEDTKKEENKE